MKKLKITEHQFNNLIEINNPKKKVVKLTEEQFNKIKEFESNNDDVKINIYLASWFTGTSLNNVKHPTYGKHKLTPHQIKLSSGDYKNKLYKIIRYYIENGEITQDIINKHSSRNRYDIKEDNIDKSFLKQSPNRSEHIRNVKSIEKYKNIKEENNCFEDFINELYSINETKSAKYSKLIKVMEGAGIIENNRISKKCFEGDNKFAKTVLECGVNLFEETKDVYETVSYIEEILDLSKDMDKEDLFKNIVHNWIEDYRKNNDISSNMKQYDTNHPDWFKDVNKSEYYSAVLRLYNDEQYDRAFRMINSFKKLNKIDDFKNEMTSASSSGAFVTKLGDNSHYENNVEDGMEDLMDEATTTTTTGNYQYATPGFASSDFFGTSGKSGKAPVNKGVTHKKTTYNDGEFVEFDDCVRLNNNKVAQNGGCSQGAIDNVVKTRKS
jgi:hypothetical protein